MWFTVRSYVEFLRRSTNRHGVHSPFVYELLTKGLKAPLETATRQELDQHRKGLLKDPGSIRMTDFGGGSRVFQAAERPIEQVARVAGMRPARQKNLVGLCRQLQPQSILELGTSLGLGTAALMTGAPQASITTVEGCPNTLAVAKRHLQPWADQSIKLVNERFDRFLETDATTYDLVFIDGDHQQDATQSYFESVLPKLNPGGLIIFDDIYWSAGMANAWDSICKDPRVTVSIDTFWWGLVVKQPGQRKQHFVLRM